MHEALGRRRQKYHLCYYDVVLWDNIMSQSIWWPGSHVQQTNWPWTMQRLIVGNISTLVLPYLLAFCRLTETQATLARVVVMSAPTRPTHEELDLGEYVMPLSPQLTSIAFPERWPHRCSSNFSVHCPAVTSPGIYWRWLNIIFNMFL